MNEQETKQLELFEDIESKVKDIRDMLNILMMILYWVWR